MRWPNHLLTLDFETFWSSDYTLKKLSTEEYVRSSLFKSFGASLKYQNSHSKWISACKLGEYLNQIPWDDVALLCQNAQFDGLILAHHYNIRPALYLCSLAMSRLVLPRQRHSLAELANHFGLPPKGDAVNLTKGLRDIPPHIECQLASYANHDADLTYEVFKRLLPQVPHSELVNIDATVRMFTTPRLELDVPKARSLLAGVLRGKRSALQRLGVTKEQLSSTDQFAVILTDRFGLDVEMKLGKPKKDGTPKFIPALAKTDPFMKSLLDHEEPDVQAIAALRLKVKSTLEETRLRRMIAMQSRGSLCVFYNFAGAHTLRWSGGDKMNWQNLTRRSEMRKTVKAPAGYRLVVRDSSQIEARMLNCLAGQWDVLADFEKGDPYSTMASSAFDRPINKEDNPNERQVGKVLELGCGYGMGGLKLRETLRRGALGGKPVVVDLETAEKFVLKYRRRHDKVVAYWQQAETAIQLLHARVRDYAWGPMVLDDGYIRLPNGTSLDYTGIVREEGEWRMRDRAGRLCLNTFGSPVRLYGGLMTENVDQALSRVVIAESLHEMRTQTPWPVVMTTHDELVALAPESEAEECEKFMHASLTKRRSWLPLLPLAAEGGIDVCYSK